LKTRRFLKVVNKYILGALKNLSKSMTEDELALYFSVHKITIKRWLIETKLKAYNPKRLKNKKKKGVKSLEEKRREERRKEERRIFDRRQADRRINERRDIEGK
jgi:hypothetical protein